MFFARLDCSEYFTAHVQDAQSLVDIGRARVFVSKRVLSVIVKVTVNLAPISMPRAMVRRRANKVHGCTAQERGPI